MKRILFAVLFLLIIVQFAWVPVLNASQPKPNHEPLLALLFGLIIPGGGQFYNGDTHQAIMDLVIVVALYIVVGILSFFIPLFFFIWIIPWFVWLYFAWQGYQKAIKIRDGTAMKFGKMKLADLRIKNKAYAF